MGVTAWAIANPRTAATYVFMALLAIALGISRVQVVNLRADAAIHLAADETARADAEKIARKTEATAATAQVAIETDYLKGARDAKASADRTISDMRAGALQLRPELTCRAPGSVPDTSASPGKRDAAGPGGLRAADAELLVRLADRADQLALQLQAAQAVIAADRKACGSR